MNVNFTFVDLDKPETLEKAFTDKTKV